MKKGLSFSVIPLIALFGVLSLTIWSSYQLSIGSKYSQTYSEINKPDTSSFKIETIKNILKQGLIYSSTQSSLEVAEKGGTSYPITFWYCNKMVNPPEIEEVNSAVSELSLDYLNSYIENSKKEGKLFEMKDIIINDSTCVGIYDPGKKFCSKSDSSNCEYFWPTTFDKNVIEVNEPSYMNEEGNVITMIENTRFYWLYYRLYKNTKSNPISDEIQSEILDICLEDFDVSDIEQILGRVCKRYEQLFDSYVECSWEIPCFDKIRKSCINSDCTRGPPEELCYPESSEVDKEKIIFQGFEGSLRFKIKLVDNKYLITTNKRELVPLVWNIWGLIVFTPPGICYPTTTVPVTTTLPRPVTTTLPRPVTTTLPRPVTTTINPPVPNPRT